MYSKTFVAAALISLVAADVSGAISAVQSDAEALSSLVAGWSSGDGLQGALGIQEKFPDLSAAVLSLQQEVPSSVSVDEATSLVKELSSLVGSISGLLGSLTSKASDFSSVGASSIVGGDIKALVGPSGEIASKAVAAIPSDAPCDIFESASAIVGSLAGGFSSAAGAYSVDAGSFPSVPACGGGSGSESSAPAGSSAAAETSAAETSAAETSAAGNGTVTSTAVETVCPTCTESGVAPSNGAAGKAMGLGAAVAGAVAMLL